ncbi:hypothetical protein [Streptomyces sp. Ncost-T6T-1]|uniref:hypothetical protein n=1 Tax=Streptomyces sp. Ncost-T6T-1 TaxID=1100828 RepID=UPI0011475D58|nr:hypothetical protein [Streptomyces sp. Ncost-T6T-1]
MTTNGAGPDRHTARIFLRRPLRPRPPAHPQAAPAAPAALYEQNVCKRWPDAHPDDVLAPAVADEPETKDQPNTTGHVHELSNPDNHGLLDDWDNCRDPECPGPSAPAAAAAAEASS